MSNDNFRRELNAAMEQISGSPSPALRERVRSSIAQAPERRGTYWMAAIAACLIAGILVGVLVVSNPLNRRSSSAGPGTAPTPRTTANPSATAGPQFTCVQSDYLFKETTPPTVMPPVAFISAIRTGSHPGYDRVTIDFSNGLPHGVQMGNPGGTTFSATPSGLPVTVKGSKGLLVVINAADLHSAYSGEVDIVTSGYQTLAEVRRVEDFEGTVQLALGINGSGCYRAFFMTNPDRLVIDVQTGS